MKILLIIASILISNLILAQTYNKRTAKEILDERNSLNGINKKCRVITKDSISRIKAVLIIGDGFNVSENSYIYDTLEKTLTKSNIKLIKIYPSTSLDVIKKTTSGANIIIYIGHGGLDNGMYLSETRILPKDFKALNFAKNHIIIFQHACYSAGSSENDKGDIGVEEAKKRVTNYSKGFINNGAGLYLATNTNNGASKFLSLFTKGMSIEDIRIAQESTENVVVREKINSNYNLLVTKGYIKYGYAYLTLENFTIMNLMK